MRAGSWGLNTCIRDTYRLGRLRVYSHFGAWNITFCKGGVYKEMAGNIYLGTWKITFCTLNTRMRDTCRLGRLGVYSHFGAWNITFCRGGVQGKGRKHLLGDMKDHLLQWGNSRTMC